MNSDDAETVHEATSRYARVMIADIKQDEFNQSDVYRLTQSDIAQLGNYWKKECSTKYHALFPNRKFIWYPVQRTKIGGKYALVTHYRRTSPMDGMTNVREYKFFCTNHLLRITISYRETESDIWAADLSKIIQTLSFN